MVAIAMMMMPAQTNALNELPPKYYPHGTAILNTLQQVAGAIGVALFISIMSNSRTNYLSENVQGEPSVQSSVHVQLLHLFTEALQRVMRLYLRFYPTCSR